MSGDPYRIVRLTLDERALGVEWGDGRRNRLLYLWLRDNCDCAGCGAHWAGSRFQTLLDIPDDIRPTSCRRDDAGRLAIVWGNDGHESRLDPRWVREHCRGTGGEARARRERTYWDATLASPPTADYDAMRADPARLGAAMESVRRYGFVFVRGLGLEYGAIEELARLLGYIRETHYGRVYDLKCRWPPAILGETSGRVLPHTDEVYRHVPTGINLFHCLTSARGGGGESILVDAHRVAQEVAARDRGAFELLKRVPIRRERRIDGQLLRSDNPAFTVDCDGEVSEVRLNERTMTGIAPPEESAEAVYRALRMTLRIAYDPTNQVQRLLADGDALVFDNLRVLHGRMAFAGERFMRQCQVMRDEFYGKLAALEGE